MWVAILDFYFKQEHYALDMTFFINQFANMERLYALSN